MTKKVVNPFLNYSASAHEKEALALTAPKPGFGMKRLVLTKGENENLYEVFVDLARSRFEYLDIYGDIDETERKLLYDHGVLVDANNIPEQSLYCCLIDNVEYAAVPKSDVELIANPSFRYVAFDFSNLAARVRGQHLSGRPSAWVTDEVTGIERGYWFDKLEQADVIAKFEAGKPLPFEVEPEFLGKLYAAGIVTTDKDIEERTLANNIKLDAAREKYINDRYCVIEELLPPEQMEAMRTYYRKYISNGFMPFEDGQAVRYYQHNEPLARVFHQQLANLMSYVVGEEVIPSYVYAGSYVKHADLNPHTDRPQCEFSISFQVDYLPQQPEHRSPWGLFLWNPEWGNGERISYDSKEFPAESEVEDTNTAVYMRSGDGLIYKGRELIHYRYPLAAGHQSTSLFFHYVPKDFEGELR